MNNLVFVYGTLKLNRGNYNHILKGRSKYLGEAVLQDKFGMKQLGYPAIFPKEDGGVVKGDVFEVANEDVWKRLDSLESNGYMYQREERPVQMIDEGADAGFKAWVYIAMPDFAARIEKYPDIEPNERGELIWS